MKIFCIEEFKDAFHQLIRKNSYKELEHEIINHFFKKNSCVSDVNNGTNLNKSTATPYIKKRFKGSGGFRMYFLLIIVDDAVYLMYVHPKTGSLGSENIDKKLRTGLYKNVLDSIKNNNLYLITLSKSNKKKIVFEKVTEPVFKTK